MSVKIFRCGINEIEYIKDAIINVKTEEDMCCFNEEAIKEFLKNEDNWFYVAIIDEKVSAYAIAYVQRWIDTMKNMICLYEIGTLNCFRRMGIAKRIIEKIIEDGKLNESMKIWIPTNISNKAACALYRSIGAKEPKVKDEIIYNYRY